MLEAHGLLQLTMRSESSRHQAQTLSRNNASRADKNLTDGGKPGVAGASDPPGKSQAKSAVTLPKGAASGAMKDFWQHAADKAAEHAPSADTMKKLQDASKSDNKEIAAQKMQQAKAKLQSLRLQAQLAAASGDKQQLRRLAQEVATAAREVAAAAHDLAGGVAAGVSGDSGTLPLTTAGGDDPAANTATPGAEASSDLAPAVTRDATGSGGGGINPPSGSPQQAGEDRNAPATPGAQNDPLGENLAQRAEKSDTSLYAQEPPADGDKLAWGEKALNSLSTDANNALSQARGLLAFIASLARGKRKIGDGNEEDRFFNELQREVDVAQAAVNHDIAGASQELVAGEADAAVAAAADSSLFGIESVTVTQVTTTAIFLNITT